MTSIRESELGRGAERRIRVRLPAGAGRRARAARRSSASSQTRADPRRRRRAAARSRAGVPERLGDRRARGARVDAKRSSTTRRSASPSSARVTLVGGVLILVGRGRDDEVPAAVRGGDLPDAGRRDARCSASMMAIEYGLLGLLAGILGAARRPRRCPGPWPAAVRHRLAAGAGPARGRRRVTAAARLRSSACSPASKSCAEAAGDAAQRIGGAAAIACANIRWIRAAARAPAMTHDRNSTRRRTAATPEGSAAAQARRDSGGVDGTRPLPASADVNSRQGDLADQASGNNEVHIQLKLKQTDAKILQAIEEALLPDGEGHLRDLPRLRRSDRARRGSRRFPGRGSASPANRSRTREHVELAASSREFHREKLALRQRHVAVARHVGDYDFNNTYQYVIAREDVHLRGSKRRMPSWAAHRTKLAEPALPPPARRTAVLRSSPQDAREARGIRRAAGGRAWPRSRNARHRSMLRRHPRRDARAQALLRPDGRRTRRPARTPIERTRQAGDGRWRDGRQVD